MVLEPAAGSPTPGAAGGEAGTGHQTSAGTLRGRCPLTQENDQTSPITEILLNSLVTNLTDGARVPAAGFSVEGIAWDSGHGIRTVELSTDAAPRGKRHSSGTITAGSRSAPGA